MTGIEPGGDPTGDDSHSLFQAVRREGQNVTPLELFFDLVFVLAITKCTEMMAARPTWGGVVHGLLVLTVLWWAWGGYAWLTSVVEPEEGLVRLVMFAAMGGFLVAALAAPHAFGNLALTFAVAYGSVRLAHLALFALASREDPGLRRSVTSLAVSSGIGIGILVGAAFVHGHVRTALWVLSIVLDLGGPLLFGVEGWQLSPEHFAERHGLIVLIALGESIVSIAAAGTGLTIGPIIGIVLGLALAAAMWWAYFDVVALVATRTLASRTPGREQNSQARDSYSFLHLPMVAGIVLSAFGLKTTLAHLHAHLGVVPATALFGGVALYLGAHVAFRLRNIRTLNRQRLLLVPVLLALVPLADRIPALGALGIVTGLMCALIAYEVIRFSGARHRIRHQPEG